jgi:hypothetical protein
MKKKELKIFISLALFIVLPELTAIMDSWEPCNISIILWYDVEQDIQWYVKDNLDILALIFLSCAMHLGAPIRLKPLSFAVLLINIIKLPLYWLYFLRFDWTINGIIFITAYMYYFINEKRNYNR